MSFQRKILGLLRTFGFDPLVMFHALKNLPRFLSSFIWFKVRLSSESIGFFPALADYSDKAGSADGHYFWQDLICAKWIYVENPEQHLDCGSRVDGFIAHLLTFRKVTQLDIRALDSVVPGLNVVQGDAQNTLSKYENKYESVSSLHSIEHFGLGRYGDPLLKDGHVRGLINLSKCVSVGGHFYVSFPIGKPAVEFNAQRIIHPTWAPTLLPNFRLKEFVLIPWLGKPIFNRQPEHVDLNVWGQAGLYKFERVS